MRDSSVTLHSADPTDYGIRAQLHRPQDQDLLRAAIHELAARGLTSADIGAALGMDPSAVRTLLGDVPQ